MKIQANQLSNSLKSQLAPIYVISGDETLIAEQCCDQIRAACKAQGFKEREVYHLEAGFNWDDFVQSANSLSLFADKKLIELRCKSIKLGDAGSKAICRYLEQINPDTTISIVMPKLDASTQKSKWYKAVEAQGVCVPVWPVERHDLPAWLTHKLHEKGIQASEEAVAFLADNVEGNLLAASQEVEKLALMGIEGAISLEDMTEAVSNMSRYTVFNLVDKCLLGNASAALKTLRGLQAEGVEPTLILWSVTRELRTLHTQLDMLQQGQSMDQVMKATRVFNNRKNATRQALQRLRQGKIHRSLRLSRQIDQVIKGQSQGNVWMLLEQLTLQFSLR